MGHNKATYKFDVSIVLNTHREGRSMHPTVRSLMLSIDHALANGFSVELVVVLDRTDDVTKKYIDQTLVHLVSDKVQVVTREADFGDLGLARNFGVKLARGEYVGVLDADDLFAENLITACVTAMRKSNKPIITHPEYLVSFGEHDEIMHLHSSNSKEFDKAGLVEYNPWTSLSFAPKVVRDQYEYKATHIGEGFGPEDWQWNIETIWCGIEHVAVRGTAYFYRRKLVGSLAAAHVTHHSILYKSELLRDKTITPKHETLELADEEVAEVISGGAKTVVQKLSVVPKYALAQVGKVIGPAFRHHHRTQAFEHYMRIAFRELLATTAPELPASESRVEIVELPDWLVEQWRKQHAFDHTLFPDKELLRDLNEYKPSASVFSATYWNVLKQMQLNPDYVLIVPWLKTGGADLVILNYVRSILRVTPHAIITVLATEPTDSPWKDKLPKKVHFVKMDERIHVLTRDEQARLLGTLLVQVSPKHIHTVSSPIGLRTLAYYAKPLSRLARLYVSAFSVDHLPDGRYGHALLDYLNPAIDYVQRVLTDNQSIIKYLTAQQALSEDKFTTNYQPYSGDVAKRTGDLVVFNNANPLKVLWAGRLDREKHPDILMKIAAATERQHLPIEFHVYGSQVLNRDNTIDRLSDHKNITYHGPFSNGLGGLPLEDFDLFLMTSEYEGMPNVLFEATGGGLPVMAPAVGGIPEFIEPGKTGYLVPYYDDIDQYISQLKQFIDHPEQGFMCLSNAQKLLSTRHGWEAFTNDLIKVGYLDGPEEKQTSGS